MVSQELLKRGVKVKSIQLEKRIQALENSMQEKQINESEALEALDQAVVAGGGVGDLSAQVVALQAEKRSLESSINSLKDQLKIEKAFENSKEAKDLRARISELEKDHKKRDQDVRKKAQDLLQVIDDLMALLIEHDKASKALSRGVDLVGGHISIRRHKRYVWIAQLRSELEKWLDNEKWLLI